MKELSPIIIEVLEARIAPATFTVTTLKDITDAGHDTGSFRDAIFNANASADASNSIVFDVHGTIKLSSSLPAVQLGSGSDSLTIYGPVANKTSGITINGTGKYAIFSILSGAVTLQDLTVTDGKAALSQKLQPAGGGFYINDSSTVTLTDVKISGNHATATGSQIAYGAGMYIANGSTVTISKSVISGNLNEGVAGAKAYGGGILCEGTLTITNSVLSGNIARGGNNTDGAKAGGGYGGAIYASRFGTTTVTITDCTIKGNKALGGNGGAGGAGSNGGKAGYGNGGGIYNDAGSVTITGTTISGNLAQSGSGGAAGAGHGTTKGAAADSWGGGISSDGAGAVLTVNTSTVTGNKTVTGKGSSKGYTFGGGIYTQQKFYAYLDTISKNTGQYGGGIYTATTSSKVTIVGTTICSNKAQKGGGMQIGNVNSVTIQDSTIAKNIATVAGGGLDLHSGTATIENDTIVGNTVSGSKGQGGGINVENTAVRVNIISTIIAVDKAHSGADLFSAGASATGISFDLIQSTPTAGTFTDDGNNIFGMNPLLGALANNGGPTLTMLPKAGSPVINTGDNPDSLTTDQRGIGFARTVGAGMGASDGTDIGAVEVQ